MNNSLEFFGTFGLSYVIALKRQLPAHDLNKVLRKQTCVWRTNEEKTENHDFQTAGSGWYIDCSGGYQHEIIAAVITKMTKQTPPTMLPSGSALLKLRAVMILFTSLSILLATPGY